MKPRIRAIQSSDDLVAIGLRQGCSNCEHRIGIEAPWKCGARGGRMAAEFDDYCPWWAPRRFLTSLKLYFIIWMPIVGVGVVVALITFSAWHCNALRRRDYDRCPRRARRRRVRATPFALRRAPVTYTVANLVFVLIFGIILGFGLRSRMEGDS